MKKPATDQARRAALTAVQVTDLVRIKGGISEIGLPKLDGADKTST